MESTATTTVAAPVDHVWDVLADHEGMSSWGPGLKVSLRTEGVPDRNGVGAVREIRAPGPAPTIVEEVIAFEPGRRLSYKALSGIPLKNYVGDVTLTAVPGGTEIAYTVSADQRIPGAEKVLVAGIARGLLAAFARHARATAPKA